MAWPDHCELIEIVRPAVHETVNGA